MTNAEAAVSEVIYLTGMTSYLTTDKCCQALDPQQRLLLEGAFEAFENGQFPP
jgi:hypothetical protein